MKAIHLVFLVEEPSMEAFLEGLLPSLLGANVSFNIHPFQGKHDLLNKLSDRLKGYARWLPEYCRIFVVVDRDDDDCQELKQRMEQAARDAGMTTRTITGTASWQVVNRIAIEELEAWYFGDWEAVRRAYPNVSANLPCNAKFRDSDAIQGGTWEAFERVLQKGRYFETGLRKIEVARTLGATLDAEKCSSRSFQLFRDTLLEAI